jgi:putative transposase
MVQEIEAPEQTNDLPAVGIDRGIAQTITLSTGEHMRVPDQARHRQRIASARRAMARSRKGSARRRAKKAFVARLASKARRVRQDWCHRTTTDIASRFGVVAVEALNIRAMTASAAGTAAEPRKGVRQKAALNRSILEQCWGQFARQLDYKLSERGGVLISVPAAYTSQTCASCGVVDARSRQSQAVFKCVACDHTDNADVNAAKEILRRSTALTGVEGCRKRPAEAPIKAAA